jgi:hypothetical protein
MSWLSSTAERVPKNTDGKVNEHIRETTLSGIADTAGSGAAAIDRRLQQLDREWDIERCLETGASSLMLAGALLGYRVNRKWFFLSAGVAGFLLQHALRGWCPPVPIFRRLGVRTSDEINRERFTLKALRGDFNAASKARSRHLPRRIFDAAGR